MSDTVITSDCRILKVIRPTPGARLPDSGTIPFCPDENASPEERERFLERLAAFQHACGYETIEEAFFMSESYRDLYLPERTTPAFYDPDCYFDCTIQGTETITLDFGATLQGNQARPSP